MEASAWHEGGKQGQLSAGAGQVAEAASVPLGPTGSSVWERSSGHTASAFCHHTAECRCVREAEQHMAVESLSKVPGSATVCPVIHPRCQAR